MHIDPQSNTVQDNYKLLANLVMPRPIAWVTSQNSQGIINLAPFHINNFAPIGRLGSPAFYCRTIDRFDLPRIPYEQLSV